MNRCARAILVASTLSLALPLAGCANFDPTDIFDNEFFNHKKPLPGERKAVFPEGTPGISSGVPPELVRGYQPPANAEPDPTMQATAPLEEKPKPKAKPKPKPKVASQQRPTSITVGPTDQPQEQPVAAPVQAPAPVGNVGVRWPDPPPMR